MLNERIVLIKNYFAELESIRKEKPGPMRFYAKSMLIFSIINSAISVSEEMITKRNLQIPGNYGDIFDILEKNKVIPKPICEDMKILIKLRNLLAHEYESFDEAAVEKMEPKLGAVKELVKIAAGMEK